MKYRPLFYGIFTLIAFTGGCSATLEIRHTTDRKKIIIEKPFHLQYDLDLLQELSQMMRTDLKIPADFDDPEIILKANTEFKNVPGNIMGLQYDMLDENNKKRVIEIYYHSISDVANQPFWDQNTFEATIYNIGIHEALHAYYDYKYANDPKRQEAKNIADIGTFDHCKMIETGDLEKYTAIIDRYFDNHGVAYRESLNRARYACTMGTSNKTDILPFSDKKEDIQYKCLY